MSEAIDTDDWNAEYEDEVAVQDLSSLVVFSRDWTVETIFSQISKGNIDLNPEFQRRNAWNDIKRSKLIESLVSNLPVPEIVLAEDRNKKGSFIVIDGKQRLLAIAGFIDPEKYQSWKTAKLKSLNVRPDLNGTTYDLLTNDTELEDELRQFMNSDIRCTVLSNYTNDQVLYDVFYRLNSGSVPLSSQELRQVLNRGEFTKFLMSETNKVIPLHDVMNLSGPDARLRDAEILLRFISFYKYGKNYQGNLTNFLSETLSHVNRDWDVLSEEIEVITRKFHDSTEILRDVFPNGKVGRKYANGKWESRFNRVLFEVECYYFTMIDPDLARGKKNEFESAVREQLGLDAAFIDSIESTTKTIDRYYTRFSAFQNLVNRVYELDISSIPVKNPE